MAARSRTRFRDWNLTLPTWFLLYANARFYTFHGGFISVSIFQRVLLENGVEMVGMGQRQQSNCGSGFRS
jgi:hypothetical protein